ncbi:MAG: hypothetical protein QXH20_05335 [Candidatus Bathyarchaeia archaeon]
MAFLGRNAVILKGTTEIGACTNVSVSIDVDVIKEYFLGSDKPQVVEPGNKTFTVSIEKAYIDDEYVNDVLSGAKVTIEVRPEGTGTGKPKITLSNVVFTSWEMSIAQDGIIMESIDGEGTDIAFGTQT